jgi:hypothetical protein
VPEIDLIEVQLENSLLVVLGFDLAGDFRFFQFPDDVLFPRDLLGKDVSRQLHGDCGKPLGEPVHRRFEDDAGGTIPVDARMREKALVLGRDERLGNDGGNLIVLDQSSALEPQLGDEAAVDREQLRRLIGRVFRQRLDRWALSPATDESPARVQKSRAERDQKRQPEHHPPHQRGMTLAKGELGWSAGGG